MNRSSLNAFLALSIGLAALSGCEGMIYRKMEVEHVGSVNALSVSKAVGDFASKQGFSCGELSAAGIQECRALGPRFLSMKTRTNSSVVELAEPYPWSPSGSPPSYQAAAEEFTKYMMGKFGSSVRVIR